MKTIFLTEFRLVWRTQGWVKLMYLGVLTLLMAYQAFRLETYYFIMASWLPLSATFEVMYFYKTPVEYIHISPWAKPLPIKFLALLGNRLLGVRSLFFVVYLSAVLLFTSLQAWPLLCLMIGLYVAQVVLWQPLVTVGTRKSKTVVQMFYFGLVFFFSFSPFQLGGGMDFIFEDNTKALARNQKIDAWILGDFTEVSVWLLLFLLLATVSGYFHFKKTVYKNPFPAYPLMKTIN